MIILYCRPFSKPEGEKKWETERENEIRKKSSVNPLKSRYVTDITKA